ncbi:MAG: dolichyl-phosphate beta-glucosyltransferase [Bacteroidota bacterium]
MELSVVIPAYNESDRIVDTLHALATYFAGKSVEILVVDDGSKDDTKEKVKALQLPTVTVLSYGTNRGKGYAVKYGVAASKGRYILMTDADLSTPIECLADMQPHMKEYPVVIGSRALAQSQVTKNWFRGMLGTFGNSLIQLILPGIQDTQCGFKLFEGNTARSLFAMQQITGFGFDFEILYLARKFGYPILELPVKWTHHEGSKVKPWHYVQTLSELGAVVWQDIRGAYKFQPRQVPV